MARELAQALEAGDETAAEALISELNEARSRAILRQLAELTREVHHSFHGVAADPRLLELTKHAMPDARERLSYVIEKTEESTHRTLGAVEDMLAITDRLVGNAQELHGMLGDDDSTRGGALREFVDASRAYGERMRSGLTEIMMAQEYQDLTGQVIKRTIDIVDELERGLVALITHEWVEKAEVVAEVVDGSRSHGPAVRAHHAQINAQTDVDDLLASLGV